MARPVKRSRKGWSGNEFTSNKFRTDDDNSKFSDAIAAVKVYDKMYRTDAQLRSIVLLIIAPIVNAVWYFEKGSQEQRDFLSKQFFGGSSRLVFKQFLREAVKHIYHGFSVFEKVYSEEKDTRRLVIDSLFWMNPSSFYGFLRRDGENITHFLQKQPTGRRIGSGSYIEIERSKLVVFTHDKRGDNPVGLSAFRPVFRSNYFKEEITKILGIHVDRWGSGIGRVTMGSKLTRDKALTRGMEIVKNLRSHEYAGVVDIEGESTTDLISMPGKAMIEGMLAALRYFDNDEAKSLLAQFTNVGTGEVGNKSSAEVLAELFILFVQSVADYMAEVINNELVREIIELNFSDLSDIPVLKVRNVLTTLKIGKIMQALAQMATMGVVNPGPNMEQFARELVGVPPEEPGTEFAPVAGAEKSANTGSDNTGGGK